MLRLLSEDSGAFTSNLLLVKDEDSDWRCLSHLRRLSSLSSATRTGARTRERWTIFQGA